MITFNPEKLREQRKLKGFTQKALGVAVGASERLYQKWEAGDYEPSGNYMLRLLIALDCTPYDLSEEQPD
ncbi:MAG: helix-turn-helix transcriptional regulator [Clostridiales bacterium]|nr:helix-turn-helix transcriptional regulator [Clostridiales bacterium]